MSELDDMLRKKRAELPQAYELTGTEAGTGTVTAPKDMTDKQALAYDEAIRRQMDPARAEKSDEMMARIKAQAQEEHRKKLGKPRPTYFPQQADDEDRSKLESLFKKIGMGSDPVSGDELTRTEESQNRLNQFETNVDEYMKTGNYDTREEAEKAVLMATTMGNFGIQTIPTKKDPIETAGDTYAPHAPEGVDTSDEYEREVFGMDASEQQFQKEYADQDPVSTSQTEVDGNHEWTKLEYEDGAIWLMSPDGDVLRQEDVTPESAYKAASDHTTGMLQPSVEVVGMDSEGKPIYQVQRKNLFGYGDSSGEGE